MAKNGSDAVDQLSWFPELCNAALGNALSVHGFSPAECDITPSFASQVYANDQRYIALSVSLDLRDSPLYCRISLGDGARDWPERDWNAVPLWLLVEDLAPEHFPRETEPYALASIEQIAQVLAQVAADLTAFASDFVRGDLSRFRRLRAEQTRGREPYIISRPGADGKYVSEPDAESAALKARFSESE